MTLYVGEAVRIRTVVTDPETGAPLDPPPTSVTVSFWGPPKNPAKDPSVRGTPDQGPFTLEYRTVEEDFIVYVDTVGWAAGKWTYQVVVTRDTHENWEYATLTLKP